MDSIQVIKLKDKNYPPLLREIPDAPSELHIKGSITDWQETSLAIVGTRRATQYGLKIARSMARDLAANGITIISGLALGIDAEAHRGALEAEGRTIAVLGSGINQIYPATNQPLAQKIIASGGAVISELPPDFPPDKWTFPKRNRIVAGLSQMTLVIEAPERSGALITAFIALDYNREVGAIPGEITSINSRGTNNLIKLGASLVRNTDDVLEILKINKKEIEVENLSDVEKIILKHLDSPQNTDELLVLTRLPMETLNQKISMLELKGIIKNKEGEWHKNVLHLV